MKCLNCEKDINKKDRFCPNCGAKNIDFKENIIDKNIDKTIESIKQVNAKITNEITESEHVKTIVETSKNGFNQLNIFLSNIFFFVGVLTIVYSLFFEPDLYLNAYNYTKPTDFTYDVIDHFVFLFIYVSFLLVIPIAFIIIKFSESKKVKKWIIPLIIIFSFFTLDFHPTLPSSI